MGPVRFLEKKGRCVVFADVLQRLNSYHALFWIASSALMDMFIGVVQKNPPKISTGCVVLGKTVFAATQHWQVMDFSSPCECPRRYPWPARYVAVLLTHFYTCSILWNGALLLSCPVNWLISVTTFFFTQKLTDLSANDLCLHRIHFVPVFSSRQSSNTCLLQKGSC